MMADVRQIADRLHSEVKEQYKKMDECAEAVDRMGERVDARVLSIANQVLCTLQLA